MTATPPPLTDEQLAAIRTRRHLATGGSWYLQPAHGPNFVAAEHHGYEHGIGDLAFGDGDQADADREFVLNAHDDVTALLVEVDRLRAERDQARAQLAEAKSAWRRLRTGLIATHDRLDVPFSNAPEQSPWTRMKPTMLWLDSALNPKPIAAGES